MEFLENIPLRAYNTFGIAVNCAYFVEVKTIADLQQCLMNRPKNVPLLALGGGSNILFTQNFAGLTLKINIEGIEKIKEDDDFVWIKSGAGVVWHTFVLHCINNEWAGVENLSLIPGTVGAAPMQNIGAYGVEIKDIFDSLEAVTIDDGSIKTFDHAACAFGYRESVFKSEAKNKYIIATVTFKLRKKPLFNISYGALKNTLIDMGVAETLTLQHVGNAVVSIRQSKLPNPAEIGNCGSFFKNPEIDNPKYEVLKTKHPTIVAFAAQKEGFTKISAGWLIEQCGWKGKRIGRAGVYDKQALVLVNLGEATGAEVLGLAQAIQESVWQAFDIRILPEVNIV